MNPRRFLTAQRRIPLSNRKSGFVQVLRQALSGIHGKEKADKESFLRVKGKVNHGQLDSFDIINNNKNKYLSSFVQTMNRKTISICLLLLDFSKKAGNNAEYMQ
jgi:hypothetical protein